MKNKILYVLLIIPLFFISGCSTSLNLNEKLIIKGVGIDSCDQGFELSFNIVKSGNFAGAKEEDSNKVIILKSKGETILDTVSNLKNDTGSYPFFSQNLILIIGEQVAKDGVYPIIDFFINHYECRPSVEIMVAKGKAADIMNLKFNDESMQAKDILSIVKQSNFNELKYNVKSFVADLKSEYTSPKLPFLNIEDDKINADQMAILKKDKLIDILDKDQRDGFFLASGQAKGLVEVIQVGKSLVTYNIVNIERKIDVTINKVPKFNININLQINVYGSHQNIVDEMKVKIKESLEEKVKKAINKAILEDDCDIFNFNRYILKKDYKYFNNMKSSIDDILKNSIYEINILPKIKFLGQKVI